jgi:hypothetical protein
VEIEIKSRSADTPAPQGPVVPHTTAGGQGTEQGAPQRQGDDSTTTVDAGNDGSGDDGHQPADEVRSQPDEPFEELVSDDDVSSLETESLHPTEAEDAGSEEEESAEEPEDSEEEQTPPATRTSGRERRPPTWQASGEFVMSNQAVGQPSSRTEQNIELLSTLIAKGIVKPDQKTLKRSSLPYTKCRADISRAGGVCTGVKKNAWMND